MVKAYLRYDGSSSIGVITSRECNVILNGSGSLALTGCVEAVGVWNLRQGVQVRALKTQKASERVTRLCLKDERQPICAAGYADGTVRLWNFEEGVLVQTFQGHKSSVACLAFNRSGHLLASGASDTDIVLWDIISETGVARLRGHVDQVTAVTFWEGPKLNHSDETPTTRSVARLISGSKDRFVRIWSIELQICLQIIAEHKVEVWSLALNSEQTRLVAGSADKFLRFWTLSFEAAGSEEEPLAILYGAVPRPEGQGSALTLQFARPKAVDFEVLLCQGSGKTLEFFRCHGDAETRRRLKRRKKRVLQKKLKKATAETGLELEKDVEEKEEGTAPVEGGEGTSRGNEGDDLEQKVQDADGPHAADEFTVLASYRCAAKALSMAWCTATSQAILGLTNNVLEALHLGPSSETGTLLVEPSKSVELPGHRTGVRCLAVSHDDSLLMSMSSETVKIWNTTTYRCVRTMPSGYGLCGFFVAGNDHALVGTKEGHLELYDLRVGELAQRETPHTGAVYGVAEQPDHKGFSSCSADRQLRFYEFTFTKGTSESCKFQEVTERATELPDEGLAVAYSPNGKWIAVALLNNIVQLMFADTLKFYLSLYGHRLPVMCVDFSSDSQIIASGSADKNVKLWSSQFGNCLRSLRAHDESVMQVRFLPGTHYLASASRDRELKLWDCDSYELITVLKGHAVEILALALSQDAAFIVTAGNDRQIRFWRRGQEQLFLSEERTKEMEDKFDQDVEREDMQAGLGGEAVTLRPSRRTIESVRSTERLMEILDEAASEDGANPVSGRLHPCARVIQHLNTLTANNIYEVLLALPFSHALRLLQFICRFFEAVAALPAGAAHSDDGTSQTKVLSAAATLETPCQAALITTYVHHSELAMTPRARPMVLRLRQLMRELLQAEKDRIGLSMAGFAHLHRMLKRSPGLMSVGTGTKAKAKATKPAPDRPATTKRKR